MCLIIQIKYRKQWLQVYLHRPRETLPLMTLLDNNKNNNLCPKYKIYAIVYSLMGPKLVLEPVNEQVL